MTETQPQTPPNMRRRVPTPEEAAAAREYARMQLRSYYRLRDELTELRNDIAQRGMGIALSEQTSRREASDWADPTAKRGGQMADHPRVMQLRHLLGTIDQIHLELERDNPPAAQLLVLHFWEGTPIERLVRLCGWDASEANLWRRGIVMALCARMGWL